MVDDMFFVWICNGGGVMVGGIIKGEIQDVDVDGVFGRCGFLV